jgi:hypothetical protein
MTQEVLKLALEALEGSIAITMPKIALRNKAITAIKEALREHAMREVQRLGQEIEQEPVSHCEAGPEYCPVCNTELNQEPAIYPEEAYEMGLEEIAFYTAPPQRTWVDLTDEEVMVAAYQAGFDIHEDYENEDDPEAMHWWTPDGEACDDSLLKLRDLIEAKLKEKNT